MKKLVELDAALDGVANILDYEIAKGHSGSISRKGVVDMLTTLPTVDAVPVVHGWWKEDPSGYGFWICSACGFVSEASAADMLYKFCPVCGAKMDGKDGDHEKAD